MNKNITKIAFLSLSLLLVPTVSAHKEDASSQVTFKDIQKIKTCVEFPLGQTPFIGVLALDPLKCGVKYEYAFASDVTGKGVAKWKTEFTIGDAMTSTKWIGQLARTALVEAPLATDTWVGQKLAVISAYVLFVKKEARAKMAELVALQKQQPATLEAQRAQVSKILVLKAEIAELLA